MILENGEINTRIVKDNSDRTTSNAENIFGGPKGITVGTAHSQTVETRMEKSEKGTLVYMETTEKAVTIAFASEDTSPGLPNSRSENSKLNYLIEKQDKHPLSLANPNATEKIPPAKFQQDLTIKELEAPGKFIIISNAVILVLFHPSTQLSTHKMIMRTPSLPTSLLLKTTSISLEN